MAVLLYYPLVNPPTEVVHQSLLYWDGIASVVPADPEIRAAAVGRELRELEQRELYTPLCLDQHLLLGVAAPDRANLAMPDQQHATVLLAEMDRLAARPAPPRPTVPPEAILYCTKVGRWFEDELVRRGLAARMPGHPGMFSVSQEVQNLTVSAVARELSHRAGRDVPHGRSFVPYTDSTNASRTMLRPATRSAALAWEMELGRLLPVPAPGTPTAVVLAFREQYADERLRLMRALHRLLGDLRRDYEHPADVFAQLRVELEQAVAGYQSAVRASRAAWLHRSVTVTVALAAAAGGALLLPDLGWLLGTVGGYALNVATREIRPAGIERDAHDFSYLHRVRSALA
ncbi:hypothetical protein H9Y04_09705 [Streptomyces sp. TRM66268-LWL]|uniref:Uncharacterized protein n=1 Tax=Streptomyces polyasparticus TaxID=2767826 RepID=A0ABR7SD19_9ACTN|nr:hypothetical protein [Streptomyces polyasparticus]MBC9712847.1 hypothetical protein [Streptomyces polyasparticus]